MVWKFRKEKAHGMQGMLKAQALKMGPGERRGGERLRKMEYKGILEGNLGTLITDRV